MFANTVSAVKPFLDADWQFAMVVLVLLVALLARIPAMLKFFDYLKGKKSRSLRQALQIEVLTNSHRKLVEDELNKAIFREATGITGEKIFRERILEARDQSNGKISLISMRRAREYLKLEDGVLTVQIDFGYKVIFAFNIFALLYMIFMQYLLLIATFSLRNISQENVVLVISASLILFLSILYFSSQIIYFSIARRLKRLIGEIQIQSLAAEETMLITEGTDF